MPRAFLVNHAWRLPLLAAVLALASCSGSPSRPAPNTPIHDTVKLPQRITTEANAVLFHALALVGTPYQWGGNTPRSGFDCSGLVDYVYRAGAHMALPRTSHAMSEMDAPKIRSIHKLASGDLLFFRTEGHRISHVAIYVGDGRFVHAPNSGGTVRLDSITNPYWLRHFAYALRVLEK
ncbi:MAG TPA: C40 family peptidase [Rhodanobacteraceae bacterium]